MTTPVAPPVTMTWRARMYGSLLRTGRMLLIAYLVVLVLFSLFQSRLIFIGASSQGAPAAVVKPPPGSELLHLTASDGTPITALLGKAREGSTSSPNTRPTILYFYGNAMCLNDSLGEFQQFRQLGANVMLVDYAGYGMSGGSAGEQGCYLAAETAYQHLLTRTDLDTRKIIPAGWSLGGAVAIDLAARHAHEGHICGLMTFSSFTSLDEVGQYHYPLLPVSLLLRHHFYSEQKMRTLRLPMLIGHGRQDNIIPFPMAERLAAAAEQGGSTVKRLYVDKSSHNDFFILAEEDLDREVSAFLGQF